MRLRHKTHREEATYMLGWVAIIDNTTEAKDVIIASTHPENAYTEARLVQIKRIPVAH